MTRNPARWPFAPDKVPMFYGWPVLMAGTLGVLMSVPGQTMGVSVFTDHMIAALGLTRSQLSSTYMLGTIGSAMLLPLAGKWYDRFGARVSAAASCLFLALVLVLLSRSDAVAGYLASFTGMSAAMSAFWVILPAFFFLRLWGQGMLTLASNSMIAKWFDRRRGLAFGISGIFTALGFSYAPVILDAAITLWGWRGAYAAMALVIGFGFLPLVLLLYRDNPEACGLIPDSRHPGGHSEKDAKPAGYQWTRRQARSTAAFWVFSLSFALAALHGTGFTFHIVSIFENAGMDRTQAVAIFFPASVVAVSIHLSCGWLSDRVPLNLLLALMLTGIGLSTTGLMVLGPGWPVVMIIIGNGIYGGLFGLLGAVVWAKYFGKTHLGAINGLNMSVVVLHSAMGPVLFSQSLSWTGSYRTAGLFGLAAAVALLAAAAVVRGPVDPDKRETCYNAPVQPDWREPGACTAKGRS